MYIGGSASRETGDVTERAQSVDLKALPCTTARGCGACFV